MIKLLIPMMPTTDDLLPYLRRIDANKVYVNGGELTKELESTLLAITGVPCVVASNGTVALELALKVLGHEHDDYKTALVPAVTFCATGLAANNGGLHAALLDVDGEAWQLSSDIINNWRLVRPRCQIGAVMPVAAFGNPVDVKQWENYDYPVIIDAAGAFGTQDVSHDKNITTCFSLHATKFIGCGEGGIVASNNPETIAKVRSLSTFGKGGTNAKMSEYHAAVTLASLNYDFVAKKQAKTQQIANWYVKELKRLPYNLKTSQYGSYSTMLNILLPVQADEVIKRMADEGIETKQWYRPYLDERTDFTANDPLPVTNHLRKHLVGLPFHTELTQSDVAYICDTLKRILLCA